MQKYGGLGKEVMNLLPSWGFGVLNQTRKFRFLMLGNILMDLGFLFYIVQIIIILIRIVNVLID